MDKPYRVTWKAGSIVIHVPNGLRAVDVARDFIGQINANRFTVEPSDPIETEIQGEKK